ncbi:MAG TPA: heavy metal-associated domain-containing protein [Blastocatellia bacterium]|nr:heavy metal-associated domain-containing protein [Blastocatellia bacterium]
MMRLRQRVGIPAVLTTLCVVLVATAPLAVERPVPNGSPPSSHAAAAKNERVLIAVEGMSCTSCAKGIKAMLKRTPGVVSAEVSYERREASVEYDPSRTSTDKIVEAITNLGYKATLKE